jgi:hypothetical protein
VHSRTVVRVLIEDTTLTVHGVRAVIVAVPRHSTADVNRFRAKDRVRSSGQAPPRGRSVPAWLRPKLAAMKAMRIPRISPAGR